MINKLLRLLIIASTLILNSTAIAETVPIPEPANAPAHTQEEQTSWRAKEGTIKLFKGKKVLTGMTIRPNALEIRLTESFSYETRNVLSEPSRLEIDIHNAANGLGVDMIDINKIGIAQVFFISVDNFLRVVVIPAKGTPLPSRIEVINNSRGLLIHMAGLLTEPHPAPAIANPAIPADSAPPAETVTPSTLAAQSTPAPISVKTETLPDIVTPVAAPRAKSNGYFSLIVGESVNRKKLDPVVGKVRAAGFKADVAEVTKEVEVFRLIVACYAEGKLAELRRSRVALCTNKAFIARDGDSYCVVAGSLMSEESARSEQKRLATKGLKGLQIVRAQVPLKVWRVTTGRNADVRKAVKSFQALTKNGIKVNEVRIVETDN